MGKLVSKATTRKQDASENIDKLIKFYLSDLDEYYNGSMESIEPKHKASLDSCFNDLEKYGQIAVAKLYVKKIEHGVFKTQNKKLKASINPQYVGKISDSVINAKDAKLILDYVDLLQALKREDKIFSNVASDLKELSVAMAETRDLQYNRYWIESYDEYQANYEFLLNSGDAESALFLANTLNLSKDDFKQCEDIVLKAKNAEFSRDFADIEGANIAKHRKIVIDSKDAMINSFYLRNKRCTVKQIAAHKAAMLNSTSADKLKAITLAVCEKPELFSQTEINSLVKSVAKSKNPKLIKSLLTSNSISVNDKAKLEQVIMASKEKQTSGIIAKKVEGKKLPDKKKENKPSKSANKSKKDDKKSGKIDIGSGSGYAGSTLVKSATKENKKSTEDFDENTLMAIYEHNKIIEENRQRRKAQEDVHQM